TSSIEATAEDIIAFSLGWAWARLCAANRRLRAGIERSRAAPRDGTTGDRGRDDAKNRRTAWIPSRQPPPGARPARDAARALPRSMPPFHRALQRTSRPGMEWRGPRAMRATARNEDAAAGRHP